MDANMLEAPRQFGNRIIAIIGMVAASFVMTGCATNSAQLSDTSEAIVTNPSERVAIKYNQNTLSINDLPPEVASFLNEGKVDVAKMNTITPTKVGTGSYNHAILNNAKATDVVAIDPNKFAPPVALPDYGTTEEVLQRPVDFVAQAPAYFAAAQPPHVVTRSISYASVKTKKSQAKNTKIKTPVKKANIKTSQKKKVVTKQRVKVKLKKN